MSNDTNKKSQPKRRERPQHWDGTKDRMPVMRYVPAGKGKPIRYENLHPGSYFMIFAEPSRKIFTSTDKSIYQRSYTGFYSEHVGDRTACVLHPKDLVIPYRMTRIASAD